MISITVKRAHMERVESWRHQKHKSNRELLLKRDPGMKKNNGGYKG